MSDEIRTTGSPSQILSAMVHCIKVNRPIMVEGPLGSSKTTLAEKNLRAALRAEGYKVGGMTKMLSTLEPPDMSGAMHIEDGITKYGLPEQFFPSQETIGDCDLFIVTLDEATHERLMLKPLQRYILEREINGVKLDPRVRFVLTSNMAHEGAQLAPPPPALKDRWLIVYIKVDYRGWIDNFAVGAKIDPVVIAWVDFHQGKMWESPDLTKSAFCSPRGTAACTDHINLADSFTRKICIEGQIGYDWATDLIGFKRAIDAGLPDVEAVLADPDAHDLPTGEKQRGLHVALAMSLANRVTPDTFDNFLKFVKKFTDKANDKPLEVLAVVSACEMQPELKSLLNNDYVKWIAENSEIMVHNN